MMEEGGTDRRMLGSCDLCSSARLPGRTRNPGRLTTKVKILLELIEDRGFH